jgi:heavy metal sensor kinase
VKLSAPTNLRTRLTFWYVGVLALLLMVYATVVFAFQYAVLTRQLYHDEVQDVITVEGLLSFDQHNQLQLSQSYYSRPQSHLLVDRLMEVRDLSGNVLYRSSTLHGMSLGGALRVGEGNASFDEHAIRLADGSHAFVVSHIHYMQGHTVVIRLAYSLTALRERMDQFLTLLLVAIPVALITAGLAGQAIASRALRPLEQMTAKAQLISAKSLSQRLQVENENDELGHLASVFNQLLQRLEQAFQQLHRFTADAAHELRTPLAAIRTIGEVTLEKANGAEPYRDAIGNVLEETIRLSQTIDGLLLLSKAESTQSDGAQTAFIFTDLVNEVLALLEVLGEERGVTIVCEHPELGACDVYADRSLMRMALMNVLHNALKFSPNNSTIKVSFARLQSRAPWLQISIEDEGPGISPTEYAKVFERFFTNSSQSIADTTGAGLGLSIAKLVIERSGGRIWFDEASHRGARCLIELLIRCPDAHD